MDEEEEIKKKPNPGGKARPPNSAGDRIDDQDDSRNPLCGEFILHTLLFVLSSYSVVYLWFTLRYWGSHIRHPFKDVHHSEDIYKHYLYLSVLID